MASGVVKPCGGAPRSAPKKSRSPNVWDRSNARSSKKKKEINMPEKNLLTGFSFFSDVDSDTLEAISKKGEILEFNAEDVIFYYEEPSTHMYGLLEGEVDLILVFKD